MAISNSTLKNLITSKEDIKVYFLGQRFKGHWVLFGGYTFEEFNNFPFEYNDNKLVNLSYSALGFHLTTSPEEKYLYECKANTFWSGSFDKKDDVLLEGIVPKGTEYFPDDNGKMLCARKFVVLGESKK